jgi:hypothetical protein
MKPIRAFIPLALMLLLAACGGGTTETAPPAEPSEPITPAPGIPAPITPTPPEQPDSTIPWYGEWRLVFTTDTGGVSFTHSLNITDPAPEPLINGGMGLQDYCIEEGSDPCDVTSTFSSGFGFMGNLPLDDGTTPLSVAIFTQYRQSEEADLKIFSIEDIVIGQDSQGRDSYSVLSAWAYEGEIISIGTIDATLVGPPRRLDPISPYGNSRSLQELKTLRQR